MYAHFRVARPVSDLARSDAMYQVGLGFVRIGHFDDHDGFDGVMLGITGAGYHLEFTYCRTHPVAPAPTLEDLLVFYLPTGMNGNRAARRCWMPVSSRFLP